MEWAERIGRRIKLRDLHILLAVAEAGSMMKASEHLAISHPVVSKTISDLEHTLGVRVFDRSVRGVELTAYGQALLRCSMTVFDEMRQSLRQIEFLANPDRGELRIGCPEVMIAGLFPALAERFLRQYPGVQLQVGHADTALMQFNDLRQRKAELLIGRMPRSFAEEDLIAEHLFDEPFLAVAGLQTAWARRRHVELADLVDEPWILPPVDSVPGALIANIFRATGLRLPRASMVSLSIQLTATLVATGRFVALLPGSILKFGAARLSLKVLPIKTPAERTSVGIITVKNRTLSPLAERFITCARDMTKLLFAEKR